MFLISDNLSIIAFVRTGKRKRVQSAPPSGRGGKYRPEPERCRSRPSRRSCRCRSSTHTPLCRGPANIESDASGSPQVCVVTTRTALTSRCPTEVPVSEMSRRKQARPIRVYESEDGVGLEPPQIVNGKECCVVTSDKCISDKITYTCYVSVSNGVDLVLSSM